MQLILQMNDYKSGSFLILVKAGVPVFRTRAIQPIDLVQLVIALF